MGYGCRHTAQRPRYRGGSMRPMLRTQCEQYTCPHSVVAHFWTSVAVAKTTKQTGQLSVSATRAFVRVRGANSKFARSNEASRPRRAAPNESPPCSPLRGVLLPLPSDGVSSSSSSEEEGGSEEVEPPSRKPASAQSIPRRKRKPKIFFSSELSSSGPDSSEADEAA
ncbi:unnamed protein product [Amoebophrya sp. A25]|nr:unnamed protein product [Amoebophrya sp. A25]|eukprot:GSA25T00000266001.1